MLKKGKAHRTLGIHLGEVYSVGHAGVLGSKHTVSPAAGTWCIHPRRCLASSLRLYCRLGATSADAAEIDDMHTCLGHRQRDAKAALQRSPKSYSLSRSLGVRWPTPPQPLLAAPAVHIRSRSVLFDATCILRTSDGASETVLVRSLVNGTES
jgi:hypothetical protein